MDVLLIADGQNRAGYGSRPSVSRESHSNKGCAILFLCKTEYFNLNFTIPAISKISNFKQMTTTFGPILKNIAENELCNLYLFKNSKSFLTKH